MRVAFIGLGAMGKPMAANIGEAGVDLTVFNRNAEKSRELQDSGAKVADAPRTAAHGVDIVCTCVSTPDALRSVLLNEQGAISGASPGTLFIDFSTVDPETTREMEAACVSAQCSFIEAPVSGGVGGAKGKTLTIIVGGERADYERALPLLNMVGTQITHVGPVGAGSMIKLLNQLLVGANLAAVLEAFVLGKRAGIEPDVLYDILRGSAGNSGMLNRAIPGNLMPRNFDPGFTLGLLLKDLKLVTECAERLGISLPMTAAARGVYEEGERHGLQDLDMTAAVLPMEQRHGVEVTTEEA